MVAKSWVRFFFWRPGAARTGISKMVSFLAVQVIT